jgi:hypothetical protein
VAVERIAVERLGVEHELAALGVGDRGRDRDLAAELVRGPGLAVSERKTLPESNQKSAALGILNRKKTVPETELSCEIRCLLPAKNDTHSMIYGLITGGLFCFWDRSRS